MFRSIFKTGIRAAYNVSENPSFVSEPWSVYPAKHKVSGQVASVFIFDKTKFESQINRLCSASSSSKNPRIIISECYELIKFEISQLAKLKHPQILTIFEVLEETKSKFLFVSEPVTDNLLTINISRDLDDLIIQKGLLQIAKGLQFLCNSCEIVHLNLQPSSVFINNQGDWKLSGFKFLQNMNQISPSERDNFYIMNNTSIVPFANLNLNYTAPELIVDSQSKLDTANDVWSVGCLIFFLYNNGESLINCFDSHSISDYKTEFRKFENKFYNHRPSELKYLLKNVPEKLYNVFPQLLARYPHDRLSVDQFIDLDFFNGSLIKAMWFVDEFSIKAINEKLVFMKGLLQVDPETNKQLLAQFPSGFKTQKLLPLLINLVISELNVLSTKAIDEDTDDAISYAITIILSIGSNLSSLTFQDRIYEPLLKDAPKAKKSEQTNTFNKLINASVKIRLTIVESLPILISKLKDKQIASMLKESVSIFLTSSPTEANQQKEQVKLQELFLKQVELFVDKFDFPYIKNTFFPLICQVFKTTTILSTKLATIGSFGVFVDKQIIDRVIVTEQLLPILKNLKSRNSQIIRNVLNFFVKLCDSEHISLDLESRVEAVLPQCYILAFGCNECSQSEFKEYMKSIESIKTKLIASKLNSLPVKVKDSTSESPVNNFESLINTQNLNQGDKDHITKAPIAKNIMQPTRKSTSSNKPSTKSTPSIPKKPLPQTKTVQPLSLKPQSKGSMKSPLSFGAVNSNTNTNNNTLLHTLQSTYNQNSNDNDDFDEFQNASMNPSTSINWGSGTTGPESNKNQPTTNYPPGFDSTIILTPTHTGKNKSRTNTAHMQNNASSLDLL